MRKTPIGVAAFETFNFPSVLRSNFATAKLSNNTYRAETEQLVFCRQNDFPKLLRQS